MKWTTTSLYVDLHTGEIISKDTAKKKYIIINKIKHAHTTATTGHIEITNECVLRPVIQGQLYDS